MADVADAVKFEEALKQLTLEGIIIIQGLLAQRALQLLSEPKPSPVKDAILKPEKRILI